MAEDVRTEPSKLARERAAQCFCDKRTCGVMDADLAEVFAELLDEYIDALIWCSGSEDFGPGGKAEVGWNKICKSLLKKM